MDSGLALRAPRNDTPAPPRYLNPEFPWPGTSSSPGLNLHRTAWIALRCTMLTWYAAIKLALGEPLVCFAYPVFVPATVFRSKTRPRLARRARRKAHPFFKSV